MTFALGMASALIVPSFSGVAGAEVSQGYGGKADYNVLDRLKLTPKEKSELAFKQKKKEEASFSENEIVIKYNKSLSANDHKKAGAYVYRSYPKLGYQVVRVQKGKKLEEVIRAYKSMNQVTYAGPSVIAKSYAMNDPKAKEMYQLSLLEMDKALTLAGNNKVTVAVVDTGVDTSHPDLKNNVLPPYNVMDPANPYAPGDHGTHVSGIIAAEGNNNVGGRGINPNATIMPVAVLDSWGFGSDYTIAEGILYAVENGADVINMSLGMVYNSPILEEAVKTAVEAGVVVVAAAGNDYGVNYNYPASYDGVITVAATNDKNEKAEFSTYGPMIDVAAPGEDVYSTVYIPGKGSSYYKFSGTSMASPVVAGVASLIKSKYPDLNTYQVEAILEDTADDLGDKGYDIEFGYGLVNPTKALQYDIKNLPSFKELSSEEILNKAKELNVTSEKETNRTGKLMTPKEVDYVKVDLEEGHYIQSVLSGTKSYDYELELRFYPEGKTESTEPIKVNDTQQGKKEGYLYKATEKGTLVIGVADRNDNFSENGKSSYELTLKRFEGIQEDESTSEVPIEVTELPFDSNSLGEFYLASESEESDKDYYKLSFDEPTNVQMKLSEIAGLNTEINVYFAEEFYMPLPEGFPESEKEYWPWAYASSNRGGVGEGEILSFEAMPGMEFIVEVSSEPKFNYYDFYYYGPMMPIEEEKPAVSSFIPYQLTMETADLPADEDMYPEMYYPEMPTEEKAVTEEEINERMTKNKQSDVIIINGYQSYSYFSKEETEKILNSALESALGEEKQGYLQTMYDRDWYKFTAEETAIYEFNTNITQTLRPVMELFQHDEKENSLYQVASSWNWNPFMTESEPMYVTLEKGKTYYMQLSNMDGLTFDQYTLTSNKVLDAPVDKNEDNNSLIRAKVLSEGQSVNGNFALPNDVDIFYYKHRAESNLFGFQANPLALTDEQKQAPKGLTTPLDVMVSIVEDTNGNMNIDGTEVNKSFRFDTGWTDAAESGSFKVKKDVGYFVILENWGTGVPTIRDYDLSLYKLGEKDEDASSVVTNNVPSKPLSLASSGKDAWSATGKLQAGVDFGDKDFYQFNATTDGNYTFALEMPKVLDGVVTIYDQDGKVVKVIDEYYIGDNEVHTLNLKKGKYFVEVKDYSVRSSTESYNLSIKKVN